MHEMHMQEDNTRIIRPAGDDDRRDKKEQKDTTRVVCTKEVRTKLSRLKESPQTYDDVLRRLISAYKESEKAVIVVEDGSD